MRFETSLLEQSGHPLSHLLQLLLLDRMAHSLQQLELKIGQAFQLSRVLWLHPLPLQHSILVSMVHQQWQLF